MSYLPKEAESLLRLGVQLWARNQYSGFQRAWTGFSAEHILKSFPEPWKPFTFKVGGNSWTMLGSDYRHIKNHRYMIKHLPKCAPSLLLIGERVYYKSCGNWFVGWPYGLSRDVLHWLPQGTENPFTFRLSGAHWTRLPYRYFDAVPK